MLRLIIILCIGICTFPMLAQDSTTFKIKDFSLKDYEAPDIKYKRLDLGTNIDGSGFQVGNVNGNRYGGELNTNFSTYINNEGYQGRNYIRLGLYWSGEVEKDTNRYTNYGRENISLSYQATNRMYISEKHFYGIHPIVFFDYSQNRDVRNNANNVKGHDNGVQVTATLSVGSGRVQPIAPAREALNILISMQKYNRLAAVPDSAQIDSLAKLANSIIYKRFFDSRFRRIYQLEELDKGLQNMGLVTNPDMVYAANLSDIWNYGMNYSRGSGTVWEMGLIPNVRYNYSNSKFESQTKSHVIENSTLGGFGFLSWIRETPINFQLQSDLAISLSAGYSDSKNSWYSENASSSDTSIVVSQALNVNYGFGYYPNTRTQIRVDANVSLVANQLKKEVPNMKDEYIGLKTGLGLNSYYYVSPRFRLELRGWVNFISDDYINNGPLTNYTENLSGFNDFKYSYRLGINYALF